jgi:alpha-tubulin suppressor-like RCC1 family protein
LGRYSQYIKGNSNAVNRQEGSMNNKFIRKFPLFSRLCAPLFLALGTSLFAMSLSAQTVPSSPISGGKNFSCARTSAGGVKCWGTNVQGQLGDGTFVDRLTPVDVIGLTSGVTAIATGERHACALLDTGGVQCWGEDKFGQLGDGAALVGGGGLDRSAPTNVLGFPAGTIIVGIAAGRAHTCAVTSAGGAKCWGLNGDGQLGNGTANSSLPLDVTGLASNVRAIFSNAGALHTCAILNTGSAGANTRCWGANRSGQLGNGVTSTAPTNVPATVTGLIGAVSLTLGDVHTCARMAAGGAKCWGGNVQGQLGNGTTSVTPTTVPGDVIGLTGVIDIAAGGTNSFFTCARTLSNGMSCWGQGKNGQLGDGTATPARSIPAPVSGLGNSVVAISAMTDFACALTSTGYKCWGLNAAGQLGTGAASAADVLVPAAVTGIALAEVFPVGGQLPAGWSKPASANAAWVVDATGTAGDGLMSLRSQPIGDGQTACTEFTAPLATGSVNFRRRVSSEGGGSDKFSVFIDGVEVASSVASGELAWANTSVPVAVGLRTVRFCYSKNASLNEFADGAWIDNVQVLEACAAGTFSGTGSLPCTPASPGNFVADVGATAQTPCALGSFSAVSGATACTLASPGSFVPTTGATAQTLCAAGSFSSLSGASVCTLASPGSFVATAGASVQTFCAAGSFSSVSGATSCTLAGLGFFVPTPGATSQTACTVGTTTLVAGATACSPIILTVTPSAGANGTISPATPQSVAFGNTTTFTITPNAGFAASVASGGGNCGGALAGTTYTTGTITVSCNVAATFIARCVPGSFSATGNAPCTLASPGSFVSTTGATSQTLCAVGTFSSTAGATACTPASPGNYVPATGATAQIPASAGSFVANAGASAQTPCATGSFSASPGATACTPASPGSFVATLGATSQTLCAAGSFSAASGATSCTLAALGFFVPNPGATAQTACAAGTTTLVTGAASCVPITFNVTPSAGANGSISPNTIQAVNVGATTSFTITANSGFVATLATGAGSCGGLLSGSAPNYTYTTAAVVANCNVIVSFVPLLTYNIVLQGVQQVPPVSPSGSGTATVTVDTVNNVISWTINFSGLTSAFSAAHFHGPAARGASAGVKIPIGGTASPLTGSTTYLEADEADITGGNWYMNIHTVNNPNGEIRGQLDNLGPVLVAAKPNDLSGDGRSDIVYKDALGAVGAVLMNGVTATAPANILPASSGWTVTHIADFDGDGKADLLIKNSDGRIAILLMDGSNVLNFAPLVGAGTGYTPIVTGDFNRDGRADIVLKNVDGSTAVLLMNGGTVIGANFVLTAGSPWNVTHAADLDGDGKTDLIIRNNDGSTALLIMNGTGVTSAGLMLGAGSPWSVSHTADLNGDGKADIVIKNTDGSAVMLLMNGTVVTGATFLLTPGSPYTITHVGDFNGDGKADLLIRHTDGSVVILQMNGTAVSAASFLLLAGATSTVAQIGDFNGDGKSDILLRNADGSATAVLMNGTVVTAAGNVWAPGTQVATP